MNPEKSVSTKSSPIDLLPIVAAAFPLPGHLKSWKPYGSGHINDTLVVVYDQAGMEVRYIFQRINHLIFKDVPALMSNIERVTRHVGGKTAQRDSRGCLQLVSTLGGHPFHLTPEGDHWRVYLFIEKARTHDELQTAQQAYEAAKAFGEFQRLVEDLPGPRLHETIPNFHDTRKRFEALRQAAEEDRAGRRAGVEAELGFAFEHKEMAGRLLDLCASGKIPERITHNDTKINNVMLDEGTNEAVCVIDLDTIMPGLSLYDFGDMVRTAVSPAAEDEKDLEQVCVRKEIFESLVKGFAAGVGPILTPAEWDHLVFSGQLMTFEVGIRFLTDYLQGDVYFKTKREGHNLDRCRTQFRLVECLEESSEELEQIVKEVREGMKR